MSIIPSNAYKVHRSDLRDIRVIVTNDDEDTDASESGSRRRPQNPRKPAPASKQVRQTAPDLPPDAKRVCLVAGRERSEPYILTPAGEWVGAKTGRSIAAGHLSRAFAAGLLAILPSVAESPPSPAKPAPAASRRKPPVAPVAVAAEPDDAGQYEPPTFADRAEWARESLRHATAGSYFVLGEPRRSAAPSRRGSSSSFRYARNQRHDDLARILAEIRPAGPVHPSAEWDIYMHRAAQIEQSFADVAGLI